MKLSVALATYNGERFLVEQLQSIAAQDRRPDELVVCDDASSDETVAIVRRFATTCPFPVRLEVNPKNLGVAANFAQAVSFCRGEVIALADQDDVWFPCKLARLEQAMSDNSQLGFVFSDATLIDAKGRPLRPRLWQTLGYHVRLQRRFDHDAASTLVKRNLVTGATMALRAVHRDLLLPVAGNWLHDGWFALLLAAVAPCRAIAEPLMQYRQHAGQQVGALKDKPISRFLRAARQGRQQLESVASDYELARRRLEGFQPRLRDRRLLQLLENKVKHLRARAEIRRSLTGRIPKIIAELLCGRYGRYSENKKAVLEDLFLF